MMNDEIQPRFIPDMSRYNALLIDSEGCPINDVHFVQNERAEIASVMGSTLTLNENFDPPFEGSEDDAFSEWIGKGIQSVDECMSYIDYLNDKND